MNLSDLNLQGVTALKRAGIPLPQLAPVSKTNMGSNKVVPIEFYVSLATSAIGAIATIASLVLGDRNTAIVGFVITLVTALDAHSIRKLSLSREQLDNINNYAGIIDAFEKNTIDLKMQNKLLDEHLKKFSDLEFQFEENKKETEAATTKLKEMENTSKTQVESVMQERQKLETTLVSVRLQVTAMENEKKSLTETIEIQKNQLVESDAELTKLEANIEKYKEQIEEQKKIVSDFAANNKSITKDLEAHKHSNKTLESKINDLTKRKNELKAEVKQLNDLHKKIKKENKRKVILTEELQDQCENLQKIMDSHDLKSSDADKSAHKKPAKQRTQSHPFLPSSMAQSLDVISKKYNEGNSSEGDS